MNKMLAIVKREYLERVRSKMFIIATLLGPLLMVALTIVPAVLMSIKTGGATRIAIIDESSRIYERLQDSLVNRVELDDEENGGETAQQQASNQQAQAIIRGRFDVRPVDAAGKSLDEIRQELGASVRKNELDGYLIVPRDVLQGGKASYYARNTGDVFSIGQVRRSLNSAVIAERMKDEQIDESKVRRVQQSVGMNTEKVTERGSERDTGGGFFLAYIVGFLIYFTTNIYGQFVLAAVVEEKTTRISEVLFSSAPAFPLMLGKLVGVSLVALTQYAVWVGALLVFSLFGVGALAASGANIALPTIAPSLVVYLFLFFLLGYFIYATIYALVGAMVTTTQEGGMVATPIIFLLIIGFFLSFAVIRSPSSPFSFWVSMVPFFSPITMLVRIATETPPFWQIALSLVIGYATVIALIWFAARVYRVGMLMYGKRATLPEVLRWVRQS